MVLQPARTNVSPPSPTSLLTHKTPYLWMQTPSLSSPQSSFSPQSNQSSLSPQSNQSYYSPESQQSSINPDSKQSSPSPPQHSFSPQSQQSSPNLESTEPSCSPHPKESPERQSQAPQHKLDSLKTTRISEHEDSAPRPHRHTSSPSTVPQIHLPPCKPNQTHHLVAPTQPSQPTPSPTVVIHQPARSAPLEREPHPTHTLPPPQARAWICEGIREAGGGGAGVCRGAAGMLGMMVSMVGNCMRAVEPARTNLIDEPELVPESCEESVSRPANLLQVPRQVPLQVPRQVPRQVLRQVSRQVPRQVPNEAEDLYIIEEDMTDDLEICPQCSPSSGGVSRVRYHHHHHRHHHHNNNNIMKNGVNHRQKGCTTRRPLVVVQNPQEPSRDPQQRHHHRLNYFSPYRLPWFKSKGVC